MIVQSRPMIYISGPIRDPDPRVVEQNICRAEALGRQVAAMGGVPVVVHTMYRTYQDMDEAFWSQACMTLLSTCPAMAVDVSHRMFAQSAGTVDEVRQAMLDSKPIFYDEISRSISPRYVTDSEGGAVRTILPSGPGDGMGLEHWIAEWRRKARG